jgi:hypothetical protein
MRRWRLAVAECTGDWEAEPRWGSGNVGCGPWAGGRNPVGIGEGGSGPGSFVAKQDEALDFAVTLWDWGGGAGSLVAEPDEALEFGVAEGTGHPDGLGVGENFAVAAEGLEAGF